MLFWFAIAIGLALPAGIGAGFTAEYFDPTIRTLSEANNLLDAPVLAWLPQPEGPVARSAILQINRQKAVLS